MPQKNSTSSKNRDQLVLDGMEQVKFIARRIHQKLPCSVSLDDLISAGTIGLIMAIDRYDPSQGVKLNTYAEYRIRGAILDSLRTSACAPRGQRRRARLIDAACSSAEKRRQRIATEEEVALELGISIEEYREWIRNIHGLTIVSLDSATITPGGRDLLQCLSDSQPSSIETLENSQLHRLIGQLIEKMPQVEGRVLDMYYRQQLSLLAISRMLNLHESRISQLKKQGVQRLRTLLATKWPTRGRAVRFHHGPGIKTIEKQEQALLAA
jgi:RNA polymerase sigma factor FliA